MVKMDYNITKFSGKIYALYNNYIFALHNYQIYALYNNYMLLSQLCTFINLVNI